jgi:hypothetical protein
MDNFIYSNDRMAVKDFESWIASYKDRKQSTLRMDPSNGALLVMDASKPIKTFPMRRGYDLLSSRSEEARKAIQALKPSREERLDVAKEVFQRLEKELLAKIEERRNTADPMARIRVTKKIGELQRDIFAASEAVQKAMTPIRYVVEMEHYNSRANTSQMVTIVRSLPYTFEERSVPLQAKSGPPPTQVKTV